MSKTKLSLHLCALLRNLDKPHLIYNFSKGGGYKEATLIGDFKVETIDDDYQLIVYIWNPDRPCMVMFLDKDDGSVALNDLYYSPKCNIKGNMTRGEGTRGMMTFSMNLLKEKGAKTIYLTDKSSIPCEHGSRIQLGPMYFLKNGVTWYEKYFGFEPEDKYRKMYEDAKNKRLQLLDIKFLSSQKCEYFTKEIINELFKQIGFTFFSSITWVKHL